MSVFRQTIAEDWHRRRRFAIGCLLEAQLATDSQWLLGGGVFLVFVAEIVFDLGRGKVWRQCGDRRSPFADSSVSVAAKAHDQHRHLHI